MPNFCANRVMGFGRTKLVQMLAKLCLSGKLNEHPCTTLISRVFTLTLLIAGSIGLAISRVLPAYSNAASFAKYHCPLALNSASSEDDIHSK